MRLMRFRLVLFGVLLFILGCKTLINLDDRLNGAPRAVHVNLPRQIFDSRSNWRDEASLCPVLMQQNASTSGSSHSNEDKNDVWAYNNWFYGIRGGVVVESGGFDGVSFSLSYLFEDFAGWTAVLIEADLQNFGAMRRSREKAININAAVCNSSMTLHYIPGKGTTGGIVEFMSPSYIQAWQSELVGPEKEKHLRSLLPIQCVRFTDLCLNIGLTTIDLWVLDVEGAELSALQGVDWDRMSISTIIMELDGQDAEKDKQKLKLLNEKGYTCTRAKADALCTHASFVPSSVASPQKPRLRSPRVNESHGNSSSATNSNAKASQTQHRRRREESVSDDANNNNNSKKSDQHHNRGGFPTDIKPVQLRHDETGAPVSRGRIYKLGGLEALPKNERVSVQTMRKVLQCSPDEPDLTGGRGTLDLIRMAKPTKQTLRIMATWAETACAPWKKCHELMSKIEQKLDGYGTQSMSGGPACYSSHVRLIRIINNTLCYDWPFDNRRFANKTDWIQPNYYLLHLLLSKIDNVGDSVFFFGEEQAYMPYTFPFFGFSNSPTFKHADIPWPWRAHQQEEWELYKQYDNRRAELLDVDKNDRTREEVWSLRKPKAAFYGTLSQIRHILFDVAKAHPDLVDAGWNQGWNRNILPWNPLSNEVAADNDNLEQRLASPTNTTSVPGLLDNLLSIYRKNSPVSLYSKSGNSQHDPAHEYKYLIVPIGSQDTASADRLASMMMYSGAVILLQGHEYEYHFSSRLKPWVHYVPLTYTTADAVAKIRWLQQNDHLARVLARNARTFALSYLRLEDMVCYVASALETISSLTAPSALEPFDPIEIEPCLKQPGISCKT